MKINLRFFYGFEKNKNIWVEVMTVAQPKQDKIVLHKMICSYSHPTEKENEEKNDGFNYYF
jgi:hypothetical protein